MKTLSLIYFCTILLATTMLAQTNPVPFINNPLVPDAAAPGGTSFTLTVNGTGFVSGSVVNWNGTALATTFISGSKLMATVPALNIAAAGSASVTVVNPAPAGRSNVESFYVRSPFPESSFGLSGFGSVSGPIQVTAADVNGDGNADLITTSDLESDIYVSLGNGNGTFQSAVGYDAGGNGYSLVVSDFNGDGNLDLASTGNNSISILIGNGDGTFQSYQSAPGSGEGPYLTVGDFNGDGKQDLAATAGSSVAILLGNGDGTFQSPVYYSATSTIFPSAILTGDFNGDGNLDLAVSAGSDNAIAILLGNGDGSFEDGFEHATARHPNALVVADFNGDGYLDLAASTEGGTVGDISVLLGDGNGDFQPHADYPIQTSYSAGIATSDLNGDGKLDLIVTAPSLYGQRTPMVAITYLGKGDGTFRNAGYFATGNFPGSVAVDDFNGDGMPDVATANSGDISTLVQVTAVLSRTEITFPKTKVGSSITEKVTLNNIGKTQFTIHNVTLNGYNKSQFQESSSSCGHSLPSGASCTIDVIFKPTSVGKFVGVQLEIGDGAVSTPQSVYLSGISSQD